MLRLVSLDYASARPDSSRRFFWGRLESPSRMEKGQFSTRGVGNTTEPGAKLDFLQHSTVFVALDKVIVHLRV